MRTAHRAPRALRRWWCRPSRIPVVLRLTAVLILGALSVLGLAVPASGQGEGVAVPPGTTTGVSRGPLASAGGAANTLATSPLKAPEPGAPGDPAQSFPTSPQMIAEGRSLYAEGCSSCHGLALQGTPGVAPSLIGVGAGPVEFYLSTGRMPLPAPKVEPQRSTPVYDRDQINALVDYVSTFGGPPAPSADPAKGDLALGFKQFTDHCAGCHQIVARGGLVVDAVVPNLEQATPDQIAEAVRMGPYLMPHFDAAAVTQHDLDSLARYVLWTRHPDNAGGLGIYNLGPIPEGMVAWFAGLLALVIVARLIGERVGAA